MFILFPLHHYPNFNISAGASSAVKMDNASEIEAQDRMSSSLSNRGEFSKRRKILTEWM